MHTVPVTDVKGEWKMLAKMSTDIGTVTTEEDGLRCLFPACGGTSLLEALDMPLFAHTPTPNGVVTCVVTCKSIVIFHTQSDL